VVNAESKAPDFFAISLNGVGAIQKLFIMPKFFQSSGVGSESHFDAGRLECRRNCLPTNNG
jgi:hypothetical protein